MKIYRLTFSISGQSRILFRWHSSPKEALKDIRIFIRSLFDEVNEEVVVCEKEWIKNIQIYFQAIDLKDVFDLNLMPSLPTEFISENIGTIYIEKDGKYKFSMVETNIKKVVNF